MKVRRKEPGQEELYMIVFDYEWPAHKHGRTNYFHSKKQDDLCEVTFLVPRYREGVHDIYKKHSLHVAWANLVLSLSAYIYFMIETP